MPRAPGTARPPSGEDERWMRRCLTLARRAEGRTSPNPMVGCVIVDPAGRPMAEGVHWRAGEPHAEAAALAKLGGRASGATLYVNLEPCRHSGRTGPCTELVAASGISRLVVGMSDPIPSHAGGAAWLARRGIAVTRDVLGSQCIDLNRAFVSAARRGRPWFVLKAGVTLDGRVATRAGQSRWITGAPARREVHALRNRFDAVLVGIGTVLADDPRLTVRGIRGARDPVRVVLDSQLRTPPTAQILPANSSSPARVIVAAVWSAPKRREQRLAERGAEIWRLGRGKRVNLSALAKTLTAAGLNSVLVEGGPTVHASFVEGRLDDELILYVAPMVFGGPAPVWLGGGGVKEIARAARFDLVGAPRRLGQDLVVRARARVRPTGARTTR